MTKKHTGEGAEQNRVDEENEIQNKQRMEMKQVIECGEPKRDGSSEKHEKEKEA